MNPRGYILRSRLGLLSVVALVLTSCHARRKSLDPALLPSPQSFKNAFPVAKSLKELSAVNGVPLYAIGDLNEDSEVDAADLRLLELLLDLGPEAPGARLATCLAAADLDLDGTIEEEDAAVLRRLLKKGEIVAPAMDWQPGLPCQHRGALFAAPLSAAPGSMIEIRRLGVKPEIVLSSATLVRGPASLSLPRNGRRLRVRITADAKAGSQVVIRLELADKREFVLNLDVSPVPPASQDLPGVTNDRPRDGSGGPSPPPPGPARPLPGPEAEEPERAPPSPPVCPQRGMGCAVLILDFYAQSYLFPDAEKLHSSFKSVKCDVNYVPTAHRVVPTPSTFFLLEGVGPRGGRIREVTIPPDPREVETAERENAREWQRVFDAIALHRNKLRAGKELAFQIVFAHGQPGVTSFDPEERRRREEQTCGEWGQNFPTGNSLYRGPFLLDNHLAAQQKVCYEFVLDNSCYSGLTPKGFNSANNAFSFSCLDAPGTNHGSHAAYDVDAAAGVVGAKETCKDFLGFETFEVNRVLTALNSERILSRSRGLDYRRLARFLKAALRRGSSHYSDQGYQGCQRDPSHLKKF